MTVDVSEWALGEVLMSINVAQLPNCGLVDSEKHQLVDSMKTLFNRNKGAVMSLDSVCMHLACLTPKYSELTASQNCFVGYVFITAYNFEQSCVASKGEQASTPEKARRTEYERVYDELGKLFDETADEFVKQYDGKCRSFTHILRTRLVTDAIGYFSKRICGEECPNGDWTKAVAVVLGKNVVHCARTRTCALFQPIISGDTP